MTHPRALSLGRLVKKDERDSMYQIRSLLPRACAIPLCKTWRLAAADVYDQGNAPICVAAAGHAWELSTPIACRTGLEPHALYAACKKIDGDPQPGTDSRTLCKVYQQLGMISNYYWADNAPEIVDCLLSRGPVLLGVMWLEKMFDPRADGTLDVGGPIAGGHEVLLIGADKTRDRVTLLNSWSASWGIRGRAYLSIADLGRLLEDGGDACVAIEQRAPRSK